jgi:hypothetical protein
MKGGFVRYNIDSKSQNCYFIHQNPLSREVLCNKIS